MQAFVCQAWKLQVCRLLPIGRAHAEFQRRRGLRIPIAGCGTISPKHSQIMAPAQHMGCSGMNTLPHKLLQLLSLHVAALGVVHLLLARLHRQRGRQLRLAHQHHLPRRH